MFDSPMMQNRFFAARRIRAGILVALLVLVANQAYAQKLTVLHSFTDSANDGANPIFGRLTLSGSTLYGMTMGGGISNGGAVFQIGTNGSNFSLIHSFTGTTGTGESSDGCAPQSSLTLVGSSLYGTTVFGGNTGIGCLFSVGIDGGGYSTLHSFSGDDGYGPYGDLALVGSNLYGECGGGPNGNGEVFSISTNGTAFNYTNPFTFGNNGPLGSLTVVGSTLCGATTYSGTTGNGVPNFGGSVFQIGANLTGFHAIHSFTGGANDGAAAFDSTPVLVGSTLYGVTDRGGSNGDGTIYKVNIDGSGFRILHSFTSLDGPAGNLTAIGSKLYGVTLYGPNDGSIYSINTDGTNYSTVHAFSGSDGSMPVGGVTVSGSTLFGMTQRGGVSDYGTIYALNVAPAVVTLSNATNATVIGRGTTTLGLTVSNSPSSGYNLNYTLTAAILSGSGSLGPVTPASGSLAPGGSQSCTVAATSTAYGFNMLSFTARDPNSSNLSQTATASLTVFDHANASLSSSATQTTQTINFGNVLKGASTPSQYFTIYNRVANTSAAYTANLKLTGGTSSGDAAISTNLAAFNGLAAYSGSNGKTFAASLNTANYTTSGTAMIAMSASQLVDDSSLSGAGNNNNGGLNVNVVANVGNATADASNSPNTFGPALTAPVSLGDNFANLESTVKSTTGSGGSNAIGTTATILAGTNSALPARTVSMQWRTRTTGADSSFASDILNLSGLSLNTSSSSQTAPYVLQISYDASRYGANEATLAAAGQISLDWLDPSTGSWKNAINGNFGVNQGGFHDAPWQSGDLTPGDWGVNTASHTVWAVLNHDSQFAVVPEPGTLALFAAGVIGLAGCARRRQAGRVNSMGPSARS